MNVIMIAKEPLSVKVFFVILYLMDKIKLKLSLGVAKGLMAVKRAAVSFFSYLSRGMFRKIAKGLVRFFVFPLFKVYLRLERRLTLPGSWFQYLADQKFLLSVILIFSLVLLASESKAYGINKYIGGQQSLLYNYLNLGEDSEFVEEGIDATFRNENVSNLPMGVTVPLASAPPSAIPTENIVGYNPDGTAIMAPVILPGISFGGRREIIKYVVQSGDTLSVLSQRFNITVDTVLVENKITVRTILRPGDVLSILPVSGVSHKVKKGDTLAKVAALYKADKQRIVDFNNLPDENLPMGQAIIIPEGRIPYTPPPVARPTQVVAGRPASLITLQRGMLWPTVSRRVSQYFKWRHPGIDIALPTGNPIYASEDGVVAKSGWNSGGYGYMILIDHENGMMTRYGHNSKLFVKAGDRVSKGDVIALIGSTGRSTGPHVHFEIYVNGTRVNPLYYVK